LSSSRRSQERQTRLLTLPTQSGAFASLINISQFFIVAQTGPVSSTVVGHVKTCTIVSLGWMVSGRAIGDKSILGVFIAIGGIVAYSIIMLKHKR
jgi:solute carrier family 35 protein E3